MPEITIITQPFYPQIAENFGPISKTKKTLEVS